MIRNIWRNFIYHFFLKDPAYRLMKLCVTTKYPFLSIKVYDNDGKVVTVRFIGFNKDKIYASLANDKIVWFPRSDIALSVSEIQNWLKSVCVTVTHPFHEDLLKRIRPFTKDITIPKVRDVRTKKVYENLNCSGSVTISLNGNSFVENVGVYVNVGIYSRVIFLCDLEIIGE